MHQDMEHCQDHEEEEHWSSWCCDYSNDEDQGEDGKQEQSTGGTSDAAVCDGDEKIYDKEVHLVLW